MLGVSAGWHRDSHRVHEESASLCCLGAGGDDGHAAQRWAESGLTRLALHLAGVGWGLVRWWRAVSWLGEHQVTVDGSPYLWW